VDGTQTYFSNLCIEPKYDHYKLEYGQKEAKLNVFDIKDSFVWNLPLFSEDDATAMKQTDDGFMIDTASLRISSLNRQPDGYKFTDTVLALTRDNNNLIVINYSDASMIFGDDPISKPGVHNFTAPPLQESNIKKTSFIVDQRVFRCSHDKYRHLKTLYGIAVLL